MPLTRIRGFLESLPEPASWTAWVQFVTLQTGNCRTFTQQCEQNSINGQTGEHREASATRDRKQSERDPDNQSALALVHGWSRTAHAHLIIVTALYLYDLIKYRLLALLTHGLEYVDCLVPGRFRFVGRTNKISGEIVSIFLFWFLVYRWTIHLCVPEFKFFPLEFMLSNRQEIKRHERKPRLLIVQAKRRRINRVESDEMHGRNQRAACANQSPPPAVVVNSIFYLKSPFDLHSSRWILRPNRTSKSWLALNLCTKFLFYYSLILLIQWFLMLYWALGGSVLTNLGFEMSYPSCAAWFRERQSTWQPTADPTINNYSYIYLAPEVLAHETPIDDIPARIPLNYQLFAYANLYSLARISMDVLENHLFYLEYILLFIAQFYILVIHSMDVILNSMEIKVRLVQLLERLETRNDLRQLAAEKTGYYVKFLEANNNEASSSSSSLNTHHHHTPIAQSEYTNSNFDHSSHSQEVAQDYQLRDQIADLQAILADHFDNLTRGYNLYISFFIYFLGVCWLSYTLVICTWMSSIRSRAVEWEFLIAESGATLISLSLMSGVALVRSQNLQLYPLIGRAMALDSDWAETKSNWMTILKYFYPRPFYCFAIFESTEISFLLCIKLLAWIISAFVILANFFYMNKR